MIPTNPVTIARSIAAIVRDEIRKFRWTYATMTQGAEEAERFRR